MTFQYSRYGLGGTEKKLQRGFEILPGLASWSLLTGSVVLSFWKPTWAAVATIAFHLYWFLRLLHMTLFLILSYLRLWLEQGTDWKQRIQNVDAWIRDRSSHPLSPVVPGFKTALSHWIHQGHLVHLGSGEVSVPASSTIYHLVIYPIVRESADIYEPGLQSLLAQQISPQQVMVILAVENRSPEPVKAEAREVQARYEGRFLEFHAIFHPENLSGEARVKGANATYAARVAAERFEKLGIPLERIVVSCLDADTVLSFSYLAALTYHFMVCPKRTRASFQPIPVYHNNIWQAPGFARVLDVGSSFFQLVEATNPDALVTFSSHSMSFKALVEIGYWPTDMISDDSAIFWKAFIHYEGDYGVVPMYVTVSMDVAASDSWRKTAINVYKQKRRWAWGVENIPPVMRAFLKKSGIPLSARFKHGLKLLEGHLSWACWPFLISIIGWLPALLASREFAGTVLHYSAPRIAGVIFRLASVSLVTSIGLSLLLLPKAPSSDSLLKRMGHLFEWLLVPVIIIFWSAIPALDAQTRLMLGRRMEFWVTEKKR